jgi:RimJ/RimL family protein N-acetyltransferase
MKGPEHIETARLVLRKPTAADAEAVYTRYSGDTDVTKYVGWPRHQSIEQTKTFLTFSEAEWNRWPAGPYLIERQGNRKLLGGTGLAFETPTVAATGYVLARDAWGARLRYRSISCSRRCGPRSGSPAIVCALPPESSGLDPRLGEMWLCA